MTKTLMPFLPPKSTPEQIESFLRASIRLEEASARQLVLGRALQGLCLTELKAIYGKHGGDRKSSGIKTAQCGLDRISAMGWTDYLEKTWGFSPDTALRRMETWTAVKARIAKLEDAEAKLVYGLLSKPTGQLDDKEWELLQAVTHKVTDQASLNELISEAKWLKVPHGSALKDAKRGEPAAPQEPKEPTPELLIQDELFGRIPSEDPFIEWYYKPLKVGETKIPVWQHMTTEQKKDMAHRLEARVAQYTTMLDELKGTI